MSNRATAEQALERFLQSDKTVALVEGTYQYRKHNLSMRALLQHLLDTGETATIVYRTDASVHYADYLAQALGVSPKDFMLTSQRFLQLNDAIRVYVDTIHPPSRNTTPAHVDYAIIYPLERCNPQNGAESVADLQSRGAKKIIGCTWTDITDVSWFHQYDPVRITYHAKEDDPDYHERMIKTPGHRPESYYA